MEFCSNSSHNGSSVSHTALATIIVSAEQKAKLINRMRRRIRRRLHYWTMCKYELCVLTHSQLPQIFSKWNQGFNFLLVRFAQLRFVFNYFIYTRTCASDSLKMQAEACSSVQAKKYWKNGRHFEMNKRRLNWKTIFFLLSFDYRSSFHWIKCGFLDNINEKRRKKTDAACEALIERCRVTDLLFIKFLASFSSEINCRNTRKVKENLPFDGGMESRLRLFASI